LSEDVFTTLPEQDWTLLVQGLDQWDETCRNILEAFDFLPRWRLEDIMASFAPMGGGVGPHFDYYDVFLIQVSGTREWQLGQRCNEQTPLQDNTQVKLLAQFDTASTINAQPGDMLYIPAGVAHWGSAITEDCITLSVGFRAPSEKEIITEVLDDLVEQLSEQRRYQDTPAAIDPHPYKMNAAVHENIKNIASTLTPEIIEQSLHQAFGRLVTQPRYSGFDSGDEKVWDIEEINALFAKYDLINLQHAPHARFAFTQTHLFVNGDSFEVAERFSRQLCDQHIRLTTNATELASLCYLLNEGLIIFAE